MTDQQTADAVRYWKDKAGELAIEQVEVLEELSYAWGQRDELATDLRDAKEQLAAAVESRDEMKAERDELRAELSKVKAERDRLFDEYNSAAAKLTGSRASRAELEKRLEGCQRNYDRVKAERDAASSARERALRNDLDGERTRATRAEAKCDQLQHTIDVMDDFVIRPGDLVFRPRLDEHGKQESRPPKEGEWFRDKEGWLMRCVIDYQAIAVLRNYPIYDLIEVPASPQGEQPAPEPQQAETSEGECILINLNESGRLSDEVARLREERASTSAETDIHPTKFSLLCDGHEVQFDCCGTGSVGAIETENGRSAWLQVTHASGRTKISMAVVVDELSAAARLRSEVARHKETLQAFRDELRKKNEEVAELRDEIKTKDCHYSSLDTIRARFEAEADRLRERLAKERERSLCGTELQVVADSLGVELEPLASFNDRCIGAVTRLREQLDRADGEPPT